MTSRLPLDDLAHHVFVACVAVSRRARFDASHLLAPHQFNALAWIEDGVTSAAALAESERVTAPSMSRTIGRLEELGYITREDDPHDGRRLLLALTPEGRGALAQVRAERDAWMRERLDGCTDEQLATLREASDLLRRLVTE